MTLPCQVLLEDQGLLGKDDGESAWYATDMTLTIAGQSMRAKILNESYSGRQTLRLLRNDLGLDSEMAKALLLGAYNLSSVEMRRCDLEVGAAFFDLTKLISGVCYRSAATKLIRRLHSISTSEVPTAQS